MRSSGPSLLSPARIALIYLAFGSIALVFSDVLLPRVIGDTSRLHTLQAIKGAVEVVLTAALIFGLVTIYRRSFERHRAEAERAGDRFAFLNSLLRHHVLNRMNVIQGYAWELQRDGMDDRRLETIQEQSAAVVDLVENVRTLSRQPGEGYERHRFDLTEMLRSEVEAAREKYPEARIETTFPGAVHVQADESLSLVFENLIANAIEHNDSAVPRVDVDIAETDGSVVVAVSDNGPGFSEETIEVDLAEEGRENEGLGLFLASTLVRRHEGELRIDEDVEEGARVVVELPRRDSIP